MGIFCEIRLYASANGKNEYTPGNTVSGAIKYFLDEEYAFNEITVSLKGFGTLIFHDKRSKRKDKRYKFHKSENYIDLDNVIFTKEKQELLPIGQYETPFSFHLPQDVPPSLTLCKSTVRYKVQCFINYYVRIKFERPGVFNFNKRFKKEIIVISGGTSRLETNPLTFFNDKSLLKLSTLFSNKKNKVAIKGTVITSVAKPGEKLNVDYEIENNTNVVIKAINIKLVVVDKYMPRGHFAVTDEEDVDGVNIVYGEIQAGENKTFSCQILIPANCGSINHSKIIARDYAIRTTVVLRAPHINLFLEIPVQVMDKISTQEANASLCVPHYPSDDPPSYWEAMGADVKEKGDNEFDSSGDETGKS